MTKLHIEFNRKSRAVELYAGDAHGRWRCAIDGREFSADAVEIRPGVFSILIDGDAFEVRVEMAAEQLRVLTGGREYAAEMRDPRRWKRGGGAGVESRGRQQVVAPMPGKVVRILVRTGDPIEAGQGIAIVEAMKMQNEVRSPKTGRVERLFVVEGQTVNAGDALATVA